MASSTSPCCNNTWPSIFWASWLRGFSFTALVKASRAPARSPRRIAARPVWYAVGASVAAGFVCAEAIAMPHTIARTSKLAENRETRIEVEDKSGCAAQSAGIKVHNRYDSFYLFQERGKATGAVFRASCTG